MMVWLAFACVALGLGVWVLGRRGAPAAFTAGHEITIAAPAARVWDVLMDGDGFSNWHPTIPGYSLRGGPQIGSEVSLHLEGAPSGILRFVRSHVCAFTDGQKMVWHSRVPYLANFIHHFEVIPLDEQSCRFRQYEEFTGLVCWLSKGLAPEGHPKNLKASVEAGHAAMNEAMKTYVEARNVGNQ